MAATILRDSWNSFSSLQWAFNAASLVAILLCSLKKTTWREVRAGCSTRRPSPALKQLVDNEPRLQMSGSILASTGLCDWIFPYCNRPATERCIKLSLFLIFHYKRSCEILITKEEREWKGNVSNESHRFEIILKSPLRKGGCCTPWKHPGSSSLASIAPWARTRSLLSALDRFERILNTWYPVGRRNGLAGWPVSVNTLDAVDTQF